MDGRTRFAWGGATSAPSAGARNRHRGLAATGIPPIDRIIPDAHTIARALAEGRLERELARLRRAETPPPGRSSMPTWSRTCGPPCPHRCGSCAVGCGRSPDDQKRGRARGMSPSDLAFADVAVEALQRVPVCQPPVSPQAINLLDASRSRSTRHPGVAGCRLAATAATQRPVLPGPGPRPSRCRRPDGSSQRPAWATPAATPFRPPRATCRTAAQKASARKECTSRGWRRSLRSARPAMSTPSPPSARSARTSVEFVQSADGNVVENTTLSTASTHWACARSVADASGLCNIWLQKPCIPRSVARPHSVPFRKQHPLGAVVPGPRCGLTDRFHAPCCCWSVRRKPTRGRLTPCGN